MPGLPRPAVASAVARRLPVLRFKSHRRPNGISLFRPVTVRTQVVHPNWSVCYLSVVPGRCTASCRFVLRSTLRQCFVLSALSTSSHNYTMVLAPVSNQFAVTYVYRVTPGYVYTTYTASKLVTHLTLFTANFAGL